MRTLLLFLLAVCTQPKNIIIKLRPGTTLAVCKAGMECGTDVQTMPGGDVAIVGGISDGAYGAMWDSLATHADVETIAPDMPMRGHGGGCQPPPVNAAGAWVATTGAPEVSVAVIDTGAFFTHPQLGARNMWVDARSGHAGYPIGGACCNASCASCCDGYELPIDTGGHGTQCAGIIAGIAPNVKIMNLRVSGCNTSTIMTSDVIKALNYTYMHGAHIVSMSLGPTMYSYGFNGSVGSPPAYMANMTAIFRAAMEPLAARNVLVIASAGNEGIDMDALSENGWYYEPCLSSSQFPNVVCVAASDPTTGTLAAWSNYGSPATVQVTAPGMDIMTMEGRDGNDCFSGTSAAAPVVSGIAALAQSVMMHGEGGGHHGREIRRLLQVYNMDAYTVVQAALREAKVPSINCSGQGNMLLNTVGVYFIKNDKAAKLTINTHTLDIGLAPMAVHITALGPYTFRLEGEKKFQMRAPNATEFVQWVHVAGAWVAAHHGPLQRLTWRGGWAWPLVAADA